jgi:hypothetical protein
MLGRKVAVAASIAILSVSGGTALAATHGSTHSTAKPKAHHPLVRPRYLAPNMWMAHHCHHAGGTASTSQL